MVELEVWADLLRCAIGDARRRGGTTYQKRLYVISQVGIVEHQYRQSRNFTMAMYVSRLLSKLRHASTVQEVMDEIEASRVQPPAGNTGVNPPLDLPLSAADAVRHGV